MSAPLRHPVLQWMLYGGLWTACGMAAQVAWTGLFLVDTTFLWRYLLAAAAGTFAAYAGIALLQARAPGAAVRADLMWCREQRRALTVAAAAAGLLAVRAIWPMWSLVAPWALPAVLCAALYVLPFGGGAGLRSIPLLKALLIAAAWTLVAVAVPVQLDGMERTVFHTAALACMRLPLFLGLCILFDIRDVRTDPAALRTWPQMLGVRGAKAVAVVLLSCSLLFEITFLRRSDLATVAWWVLPGYVLALVLAVRARPERGPFFYALCVDGVLVLIPLLVWIGTRS